MKDKLDCYSLLFDEYLTDGSFPVDVQDDPLTDYLKTVLDAPSNRQLCQDPVWRDLLKTSLLSFFEQVLVLVSNLEKEEDRELKFIREFMEADITGKRYMWPLVEELIYDHYSPAEVNLPGYVHLMKENEISKDSIFGALVSDWEAACRERMEREKKDVLQRHKGNFTTWMSQGGKEDYRTVKETESIVLKYPPLKEILRVMGREKEKDSQETDRTASRNIPLLLAHSKSREEVDGIRMGNDLNVMVPTETVWLADTGTEHLFYHKMASEQLQLFSSRPPTVMQEKTEDDMHGKPRLLEGPMIVCVDTSGSMDGRKEKVAKAMVMQILQTASRKKRKCLLITFSVRVNVLDMTQYGNWQKVKEFMKNVFTGGTDGEDMLREAMKALEGETFDMADVLVISDFEFSSPMRGTLEKLEKQKRKGTRFYGLQIGKWRSEYGGILDRMWHIN